MRYQELLERFSGDPLIDGTQLLPFYDSDSALRVQLSGWVKCGKLIKLRSNVFLLPTRHAGQEVFPLAVAARLLAPSYLSTHTALQYHGMIPEAVFSFTSVTSKRANTFTNPLGKFVYHHVRPGLFWGYSPGIQDGQTAFIAEPEKALLDLFYLRRQKATLEFIAELRLQNPRALSRQKLLKFAEKFHLGVMAEAAENLITRLKGMRP